MTLWSDEHIKYFIPTLIIELVIAILTSFLLRKKSIKIRTIPIFIISIILVVIEIFKQIYSITSGEGYNTFYLPFHFCSLFLFLLPLFSFACVKSEKKCSKFIKSFTVTCLTMVNIFLLVYPQLIYNGSEYARLANYIKYFDFYNDFMGAHTIIFHNLLPLAFFLIIGLKLYEVNKKKDIKYSIIGGITYGVFAGIMANILKTNYNNLYVCSIDPINKLRLSLIDSTSYAIGQIIYVIGVILSILLFIIICYYIFRLIILIIDSVKYLFENKKILKKV